MRYVLSVPAQTVSLPLMEPSVGGAALTDTVRLAAGDVSQAFEAATVTLPPADPAAAVMEVALEVPVHPGGNVQM
jgi:hypothetical protein